MNAFREAEFIEYLNKYEDVLYLYHLLNKNSDLQIFFGNIDKKFSNFDVCYVFKDPVDLAGDPCFDPTLRNYKKVPLLGNSNNIIYYKIRNLSYLQFIRELVLSPFFFLSIFIGVFISLFLFLRLAVLPRFCESENLSQVALAC
jgi:hypothetical protein